MEIKKVIEGYRQKVVQIATPYSTATGLILPAYNLIVTNEHVIRDNKEVVISRHDLSKASAKVVFLDAPYDIAFLSLPSEFQCESIDFSQETVVEGLKVIAIGHPYGFKYSSTMGIISNASHLQNGVEYFQHDAAMNPGNSGGPLVDIYGKLVGINTFVVKDGNSTGFALPVPLLKQSLDQFLKGEGKKGMKCFSCSKVIFEQEESIDYCPKCGSKIEIISSIPTYEPQGISRSVEWMLTELGHDVKLARRGNYQWEIIQGSAKIYLSYFQDKGLLLGEAFLCGLPDENIIDFYQYLLEQNHKIEGLTLSVKNQNIILSLLLFDKYLHEETGVKLFKHLFKNADYYDNILVEKFGAKWLK